jgi:hypothetical protein
MESSFNVFLLTLFNERTNEFAGSGKRERKIHGKYKFDIRDEKLYLKAVDDACQDRADAISGDPYVKIK